MPRTYSRILLHVVFSTRDRREQIVTEVRDRLYAYVGGVVRDQGGVLHAIGGMPDHVHLLIGWRTDVALSELMRQVKGGSSRWMHEMVAGMEAFGWQGGYAAFSVSPSNERAVRAYIERQEEHHRSRSFGEEIEVLLRAHGVAFEAGRVFE